jgi:hypothetical protein
MGWGFRRSFKLAPGVRVNLGKKSASLSFGVRGARYTTGTMGRQVTVGLPGTGLYYTKKLETKEQERGLGRFLATAGMVFFGGIAVLVALVTILSALVAR